MSLRRTVGLGRRVASASSSSSSMSVSSQTSGLGRGYMDDCDVGSLAMGAFFCGHAPLLAHDLHHHPSHHADEAYSVAAAAPPLSAGPERLHTAAARPFMANSGYHHNHFLRLADPVGALLRTPSTAFPANATDALIDRFLDQRQPNFSARDILAKLNENLPPSYNTNISNNIGHNDAFAVALENGDTLYNPIHSDHVIHAIGIKKIRRKKMNKHKVKKLRRLNRDSTRYNKERRKRKGPMREKQE
ncbi:hypothetical protein BC830DRAFT_1165041 [Chytriomyces sp. MP71]|nr:hypothetical protein BC830DRAFT_1165041 [Chytriomyces sp. MP71]